MTATRTCNKPAPKSVTVNVEVISWSSMTGYGVVVINGTAYAMQRILSEQGKTVGGRLARVVVDKVSKEEIVKKIDVDFTAPHGWTCDCEDATFRPERQGGCKHCQAFRQIGSYLKGKK